MYPRKSSKPSPLMGILIVVIIVAAFGAYQVFINNPRPELAIPTPGPILPLPTQQPPTSPSPPGFRLIAPLAHLSAPISEVYLDHTDNWDLTKLFQQAGHLQGTPFIGQGGNFVLAGHVEFKDGSPGPFAELDKLSKGDIITVLQTQNANSRIINYSVTTVDKVQPNDFAVLHNHGYEELTLITCGDWDTQTQTYLSRVIVHARPTGNLNVTLSKTFSATVTPIPGGTPSHPPARLPTKSK